MLKYRLLHPEILAGAGRGRPRGPGAHRRRQLPARDAVPRARRTARVPQPRAGPACASRTCLRSLVDAIPIEAAHVMTPGRRATSRRSSRSSARCSPGLELSPPRTVRLLRRRARPDVALAIATGERRIYANLLLTIGVVAPDAAARCRRAATDPSATRPRGSLDAHRQHRPAASSATGRRSGSGPRSTGGSTASASRSTPRPGRWPSAPRSSSARASATRTARRSRSSSPTTTSAACTRRPRSPSCSGSRASASRSRSRPAGATAPRRWTWTR